MIIFNVTLLASCNFKLEILSEILQDIVIGVFPFRNTVDYILRPTDR